MSAKPSIEIKSRQLSLSDITVISEIGEGNMGKVYLVKLNNDNTSAPFAMKVVKKEAHRMHRIERAQHEARILSILNHPFLPSLILSLETHTRFFIISKYCSGGDLNALIHRQRHKKFSVNAARFYVAEVLLALDYLHRIGIIYRDLKPENILIRETGHIVLTDFDMCLCLKSDFIERENSIRNPSSPHGRRQNLQFDCLGSWKRKTAPVPCRKLVGTEEYLAPEVLQRSGYGFHIDWWSLGILLYELVLGKTPFKGRNRKETFSNILRAKVELPPAMDRPACDLMRRLLEKDPSKRLGSSPRGAEDIKKHAFFGCITWDDLEHVRPPFIPSPFTWEAHPAVHINIEDL